MKLTADYHTHTTYSDGKNKIEENALRAKEIGLEEIAISEHGFSHLCFGIKRREKEQFIKEIRVAEEKTGMRVLVGIESNIRGYEGECDLRPEEFKDFDVYLCGVHILVKYASLRDLWHLGAGSYIKSKTFLKPSKQLVKDTTSAYINAIKRNPVDVVTHVNFQCFADAVEVAKACRDYGTYMELNSKKNHLTDEELYEVEKTGVRFVVNSDAHSVSRIGDCKLAEEQIMRVGIPLDRIDNIDGRLPNFRLAEYKRKSL